MFDWVLITPLKVYCRKPVKICFYFLSIHFGQDGLIKRNVLQSLFNKVADLQSSNFIKKRLQYRCFPVKFAKF